MQHAGSMNAMEMATTRTAFGSRSARMRNRCCIMSLLYCTVLCSSRLRGEELWEAAIGGSGGD